MNNAFFSDLIASIADRGRNLLEGKIWAAGGARRAEDVLDLCEALLSGRGEASGTAIARQALDAYNGLEPAEKTRFFERLARDFGPDRDALAAAIKDFSLSGDERDACGLHYSSEPRRQELFRRLNRAPSGTTALVAMRADFLTAFAQNRELALVDADFVHLFASWFNRGFLVLRHIDWATPANILEKIIRYEAVHQIKDWNDLRRRIDTVDRRCYAFFHPALVDEPLIFVEVALTEAMPDNIAALLASERAPVAPNKARTATFYSISNCQAGLAGVTFGNFLIKQVVEELRRELPKLTQFVTLSPVPGFMKWLRAGEEQPQDPPVGENEREILALLDAPDWPDDPASAEQARRVLEPLAAHYLLKAKTKGGRPVDPVARFHLGNGARLERVNWLGDSSAKGLAESAGLMVNYFYDLDDIEKNHEAFANRGEIIASSAIQKLLRGEPRLRFKRAALPAS